jgi:glycine oxidase
VLSEIAAVTELETDDGVIPTRHVVLCAGAWSTLLDGVLLPQQAVRPLRGQMVELEVRPQTLHHVLFAPGGYLVPRRDGRVLVGSTMEAVGFRKEVTVAGLASLLHLAKRVVPQLAAAPVLRSWSGLRPATADHLPFIGATPVRGLWFATGHLRNGVLHTPITADAVSALVAGAPPPLDLAPFSVERVSGRPT